MSDQEDADFIKMRTHTPFKERIQRMSDQVYLIGRIERPEMTLYIKRAVEEQMRRDQRLLDERGAERG